MQYDIKRRGENGKLHKTEDISAKFRPNQKILDSKYFT